MGTRRGTSTHKSQNHNSQEFSRHASHRAVRGAAAICRLHNHERHVCGTHAAAIGLIKLQGDDCDGTSLLRAQLRRKTGFLRRREPGANEGTCAESRRQATSVADAAASNAKSNNARYFFFFFPDVSCLLRRGSAIYAQLRQTRSARKAGLTKTRARLNSLYVRW